eukprot:TRINITY_DN1385_c0_g1_i2.p1 TRINITY_DN1385_c0_g1~~TRINITY_DN1385_c0_g1_i2.p1  ORF type:complete len:234 (-),score=46.06 TRINITY_DN1385_c0_g1_i2:478-1143(-)
MATASGITSAQKLAGAALSSAHLEVRTVSLASHSSLRMQQKLLLQAANCKSVQKRDICFAVRADGSSNGTESSSAPGFVPSAQFYKVEAVIRPWRLQFVAKALLKMGIRGVTVSDVRGFGSQGGSRERQAGSEFTDDSLVSKVKVEVIVVHNQVEVVISTIIAEARTGEIGDGKIFVSPVADVIRIRTGERGVEAERMAGGRQDLLANRHVQLASIDGSEN